MASVQRSGTPSGAPRPRHRRWRSRRGPPPAGRGAGVSFGRDKDVRHKNSSLLIVALMAKEDFGFDEASLQEMENGRQEPLSPRTSWRRHGMH